MTLKSFDQYTDFEIIKKISEGDIKLYEILIRRYNASLYKIGRAYRYNHHDTEDLMQETYINAFYNLSKFEYRAAFKTWLTRIMLNACHHKNKKMSFKNEVATENSPTEKQTPMFQQSIDTEKKIVNKELGQVLEAALNEIPEEYRVVFTLRELNGLSVAETTEVLNITESNVKVRLNRAKKMLRSNIEKIYTPEDVYEFNLIYCDRITEKVMKAIANPKND
ncbi:MAG: sigma-70 family polymerase sigma factor [Chitinophagaceae bacterium]|nr:sigma-70 family polymerase sigma factor [Chitinophagaceae bacterium]